MTLACDHNSIQTMTIFIHSSAFIERIKTYTRSSPTIHRSLSFLWQIAIRYLIPDALYLRTLYRSRTKSRLRLNQPLLFTEKVQWLKIHYRDPLMTVCADKYEVRGYVRKKAGNSVLNELYGVYDSTSEIDLEALPGSFVLKTNHGSGRTHIIEDKSKADWPAIFKDLEISLAGNFYYWAREWAYKNIKPRIVCEKLILEEGSPPRDYKFFCFNSVPKLIQVDYERFTGHKRNMFDTDWNLIPVTYIYPQMKEADSFSPPSNLSRMMELSRILSAPFPFARVDFYDVDNRVVFGEITFYPDSGFGGFEPKEFNRLWGDLLELPDKKGRVSSASVS